MVNDALIEDYADALYQDDPQTILEKMAPQAQLSSSLEAFPRTGSLRERFAARPYLMAPMAGVSDAAYRMMARAGGAALAYSEMVSVAGIHYGGEKTWELVVPKSPEPDVAIQLFGSKPEQFGEAAAQVQERLGSRLALIDINMACPVPKVTRKGEGSALLDDPSRAEQIVRACLESVSVPVTCKIRRGRQSDIEQAPEFAKRMEAAGAAAIAIHGRYASQFYRGQSDWSCVERVVRAVSVPVIGSGDVMSAADAHALMDSTGASAVMIARGSYGNPWIFSQAHRATFNETIDLKTKIAAFECHLRLLCATGAHLARARSLAGWYFRSMPHAASWRERCMHCVSLEDYLAVLEDLRSYLEQD